MNRITVRAALDRRRAPACSRSPPPAARAGEEPRRREDAELQAHRRRLRSARREGAGGPDHLRGRKRRQRLGDRARGARRRNDPRREGEPDRRPAGQLLADPGGRRIHAALQRRLRRRRHPDRQRQAPGREPAPRSKRRSPSTANTWSRTPASWCAATKPFVAAVLAGEVGAGEEPLRGGAHPLRADRAGGGVLRRPRPPHRRPRQRRRGRANSAASTGSRKRSGRKAPRQDMAPVAEAAAGRRRGTAGEGEDGRPAGGADRQRRQRAAGRGLGLEDHRRGGALLAHRPGRLRGQRRRGGGRLRSGAGR